MGEAIICEDMLEKWKIKHLDSAGDGEHVLRASTTVGISQWVLLEMHPFLFLQHHYGHLGWVRQHFVKTCWKTGRLSTSILCWGWGKRVTGLTYNWDISMDIIGNAFVPFSTLAL